MTFNDVLTAVTTGQDYGAFSSGAATQIKKWIVNRYGQVWASADWPFKFVGPVALALTGGQQALAAPAAMWKPIYVASDEDVPVVWMDPREFFRTFGMEAATSSGTPSHYTFANDTLYFGPTPSASFSYNIAYERRLSVLDNSNAVKLGPWDESTTSDKPIWDASFHYLLVHGALATGFQYLGSADAQWHLAEFDRQVQQLVQHYAPFQRVENAQFGRDRLS